MSRRCLWGWHVCMRTYKECACAPLCWRSEIQSITTDIWEIKLVRHKRQFRPIPGTRVRIFFGTRFRIFLLHLSISVCSPQEAIWANCWQAFRIFLLNLSILTFHRKVQLSLIFAYFCWIWVSWLFAPRFNSHWYYSRISASEYPGFSLQSSIITDIRVFLLHLSILTFDSKVQLRCC